MTISSQVNYGKTTFRAFVIAFLLWVLPFFFGKYVDISFPYIRKEDTISELVEILGKESNALCPRLSPYLYGMDYNIHITLDDVDQSLDSLADSIGLMPGGVWQPSECQSRYEVVIIVPYRKRSKQFKKFLGYFHPFLQRQQLHYSGEELLISWSKHSVVDTLIQILKGWLGKDSYIDMNIIEKIRLVVVEQKDDKAFNRARLLNIGFKEAMNMGPPSLCVIFHDVDLMPQNDYNIYACTHQPRHLWSSLDIFRYHLPYRTLVGGAFAILSMHFKAVNGFSNSFNGWGGEDDDFSRRLSLKGLMFERFDPSIARYVMLPHVKEVPSSQRWGNLAAVNVSDGLSSLKYEVLKAEYFPLYTHLSVK